MNIKYKKLNAYKVYQIIINNKNIGVIEHNQAYRKYPYTVEIYGYKLITPGGSDYFSSLSIAKKAVKQKLSDIKKDLQRLQRLQLRNTVCVIGCSFVVGLFSGYAWAWLALMGY